VHKYKKNDRPVTDEYLESDAAYLRRVVGFDCAKTQIFTDEDGVKHWYLDIVTESGEHVWFYELVDKNVMSEAEMDHAIQCLKWLQ
jgi:hypothetical protein